MLYGLLALGLILLSGVAFYIATLKRCDSNEVLIVSGKQYGANKGKPVSIYRGGTVNVLPLVQQVTTLSLIPMNIDVSLKDALSKGNIRVSIPSNFQIAFSDDTSLLENASKRLVGLSRHDVQILALDVIMGGMRAVIAGLAIEEINSDREKFMVEIEKQIKPELDKLGLVITNVNIQDITDEAGYLVAIGKKAAVKAIEEAKVEVAEQERIGAEGTAKQEAARLIEVEKQMTASVTGVAETKKNRTVQVAKLESETEQEKIAYEQKRLEAEADLEVTRAKTQETKLVAESKAQQAILIQEKLEATLEKEKEVIVDQEIAKREAVLVAEAEAETITINAKAEAGAITLVAQAKANGVKAELDAQAQGYKEMFKDVDKDALLGMEYMKIATDVQKIHSDAISGIKIDKITVIDSGDGQAAPNFIKGFVDAMPLAHELGKSLGFDVPSFLGNKVEEAKPELPTN